RGNAQAVRLGGEPLDGGAARHLPGLLFLPVLRPRPEHAGPLPRASLVRAHGDVLRAPRPERLRSELRHDALQSLGADGPPRDGAAQALDLHAGKERNRGRVISFFEERYLISPWP